MKIKLNQRVNRHDIVWDKPAVRISEAGLIGNGAMGVAVRTRPDAILLHFGHGSVWDIRTAAVPEELYGTFDDFWTQWKARERGDEAAFAWTEQYARDTNASYDETYPRPWPCGTLVLGFDNRTLEVLGHRVRLSDGVCQVNLRTSEGAAARLEAIPDVRVDRLWVRLIREDGLPFAGAINRVEWQAEPWEQTERGESDGSLFLRQTLPTLPPDPARNRAVRVTARVAGTFDAGALQRVDEARAKYGGLGKKIEEEPNVLGAEIVPVLANVQWTDGVRLCVQLEHGLDADLSRGAGEMPEPSAAAMDAALASAAAHWDEFWSRSSICLDDQVLERAWYRCLYLHGCSARAGGIQPGLYGPWVAEKFGWAWHSDYHLDYNAQQTIWGLFSSNHQDLHLPYARMVGDWLPCHERYARAFHNLPGAAYTVSLYPEAGDTPPVPSPPWNVMMCVPPWTVQSLWWHYLYSLDETFLREQAFEPIKQVTAFMNGYMRRPEAHGADSPWGDDRFHIYPSLVPEMRHAFGFSSDPQFNDCLVDLTLTKFVLRAYLHACVILAIERHEARLMGEVSEVLEHFPEYVVAEHPTGGEVFRDVRGGDPEMIYNCPNPMCHVFPGEELGLHSSPEQIEIARRTWRLHRNEGGNELVFHSVQGARLGILDLEKWKRQLRYCELPNGSFTNMILQVGGRYPEGFPFAWMETMGIWTENFAVPFVINECLLQSYHGELRFFPNWPAAQGGAQFQNLRAVGAFLVSAAIRDGVVGDVEIFSEKGATCTVVNPWGDAAVTLLRNGTEADTCGGDLFSFPTAPGETINLVARAAEVLE